MTVETYRVIPFLKMSQNGSVSVLGKQREAVAKEIVESLRAETTEILARLTVEDVLVLHYQAKQMLAAASGAIPDERPSETGSLSDRALELVSGAGGLSTEAVGSSLYGKSDRDRAKKARSLLFSLKRKGATRTANGLWFASVTSSARAPRKQATNTGPSDSVMRVLGAAKQPLKVRDIHVAIAATEPKVSRASVDAAIPRLRKSGKIKKKGTKGVAKYEIATNGAS